MSEPHLTCPGAPRIHLSGTLRIQSTLLFVLLALLVVACEKPKPPSLADLFPGADDLPGWTPVGDLETFDSENLYDLVDGQAESYLAYAFDQVALGRYENADGTNLDVEIWGLETPADAYGLFTTTIAGAPTAIGNDGDVDPGRRLAFWQNRYYVRLRARQGLPDATLTAIAQAVSAALPTGGERPALLDRLPPEGMVDRSAIFFHQEISIQDQLWLGGENLLGLSSETDGVLARYGFEGVTAQLLLVQYPDAEAASAGVTALGGGQASNLVIAEARENLLAAIFGTIEEATATPLLEEALASK